MSLRSRSNRRSTDGRRRALVVDGIAVLAALVVASVIYPSAGADSTTVASDGFQRSVSSGWGSADIGGPWSSNVPASFSVSDGSGKMLSRTAGSTRNATLKSVVEGDVDLQATFSVDKLTNGGGDYVSLVARRTAANEYRAQVQIKSTGAAYATIIRVQRTPTVIGSAAVAGLTYAPGTPLNARFQLDGTSLRFKMWNAAMSEPAAWLLDITDSTAAMQTAGAIGIMQYVSRSSTALPVTLSVSDVEAQTLDDGAPLATTTSTTAAPTTTTTKATTTTTADPTTTLAPTTTTTVALPAATPAGVGTTVGTAEYPVPPGAIIVSPSGNDAAAGTTAAPLLTVQHAVNVAPSGSTIVLRAGSYNETVKIPSNKKLTVQSWPGEAAWLDGSIVVSGWVKDGSLWRYDGWNHHFDSSPTDTRGAPDGTGSYAFLNPAYPMAAHPDQIWIGTTAERQVGSLAQVVAGTFFYDETAQSLYLGSNPTGKTVRASNLQLALRVQSSGSIVRGIGIRRYAPSVPDFGAFIVDHANNVVVENVAVDDNATAGLFLVGTNVTIRNVELARNGLIGLRAGYADNLLLDHVLVDGNDAENFNTAPVASGVKITASRTVTVRDSTFSDNNATGLWFDVSNYDLTLTGNDFRGNAQYGVFLEISAKALVADNVFADNAGWGLKINNTDLTRTYNNTFVGNNGSVWVVQESRRPSNFAAGRDSRQPYPDPTMTWVIKSAIVVDNVLSDQIGSQSCMICVQDGENLFSAEQMGATLNGNVYNRASAAAPVRLVIWSGGTASQRYYQTLPPFQTDTKQESAGVEVTGAAVVSSSGQATSAMPAMAGALPLPSDVASATGKTTGTRHYGAW